LLSLLEEVNHDSCRLTLGPAPLASSSFDHGVHLLPATGESVSRAKKTGVSEYLRVFAHAGLLFNGPLANGELPFI